MAEVVSARESGVSPLNAVRASLPRSLQSALTKRVGKKSHRILPDLEAHDIIATHETYENGGALTVMAERINDGLASQENWKVYPKEVKMSRILAKDGHRMVLRQSSKRGETYDVTIDGRPADLKWVTSRRYMSEHAEKATTKQGARMTIFMLDGKWSYFKERIKTLSNNGYHGLYIRRSGTIREY